MIEVYKTSNIDFPIEVNLNGDIKKLTEKAALELVIKLKESLKPSSKNLEVDK